MVKRRGRTGPSDPQAILQRRALERGHQRSQERETQRTPGSWGISAEVLRLPVYENAEVSIDEQRGRIVRAKNSDPFDLLHAHVTTNEDGHERRGLSDEQHRAARRLMRDWCIAAGVRDQERPDLGKIDGGGSDPQLVNQAMIDADGRRAAALKAIGGVNGRLMSAFMTRLVDEVSIMVWRAVVQKVTGETDRNAQGALVRQACESLRIHYDEVDEKVRAERKAREGRGRLELRPFSSFGGGEVA